MKTIILIVSLFTSLYLFSQSIDYSDTVFTNGIEGPAFWENNLYVVNYQKEGTIGIIKPTGQTELYLTLPVQSIGNSIVFDKKGMMYIADYINHNVLKVNPISKTVKTYAHNDKFNQPNDICLHKKGQLYASDPNWSKKTGNIWLVEEGLSICVDSLMGTTNGITLSSDHQYLYVNESVQGNVWKYYLLDNGRASHRVLFHFFDKYGMDGMKVDDKGNLYIARYGKGTIDVLDSKGKLIKEIKLKGKYPTNIAFKGRDYSELYVTMQKRKCVEKVKNQ